MEIRAASVGGSIEEVLSFCLPLIALGETMLPQRRR
jgi:hypothetical protein